MQQVTQISPANGTISPRVFTLEIGDRIDDIELYKSIIVAGDGIFSVVNGKIGILYRKVNSFMNDDLQSIGQDWGFIRKTPKPPIWIFVKILELFKEMLKSNSNRDTTNAYNAFDVYDDIYSYYGQMYSSSGDLELTVNVYYDYETNDWIVDITDQTVTAASSNYHYNRNYENDSRYARVLQVHSHNTMNAFWSSVDDSDERNAILCIFGVVGKITKDSTVFDVANLFRIWDGHEFVDLSIDRVFDFGIPQIEITQDEKDVLDHIREASRLELINQRKKYQTYYNGGSNYRPAPKNVNPKRGGKHVVV